MPYVITTKHFTPTDEQPGQTTRRAAATLDSFNDECIAHGATGLTSGELRELADEGGTVGPLPDGSVLNVEWRKPWELREELGQIGDGCGSPEEVIDAYNTAQD